MNRQDPPSANPSGASDPASADSADHGIEALLREVGARAEASPQVTEAVHAVVHAQWRAMVQAHTRRRRAVRLMLAAGLAAVVAGAVVLRAVRPVSQPQWAATFVRVEGEPQVEVAGVLHVAQPGEVLRAGMRLSTGAAQAALSLATDGALSVRVDTASRLLFDAPGIIELEAGTVYIDANAARGTVPLTVRTAAGVVRHIGTQYQVRTVTGPMQGIEVSIREGRVEIASEYGTNTVVAGERVAVSTSGSIVRSALPAYDASWQWATQMAPPFDIAGRPLSEFLEWVARETGRELTYDSPVAQRAAVALKLGGSIAGLDPGTALAAVLSTTRFERIDAPPSALRIALRDRTR
jgi:hypothetical protein